MCEVFKCWGVQVIKGSGVGEFAYGVIWLRRHWSFAWRHLLSFGFAVIQVVNLSLASAFALALATPLALSRS